MQRYFLNQLDFKITGNDAHHIKKVMRMQIGENIVVCFDGKCYISILSSLEPEVNYEIKEELVAPKRVDITLIQGLPKHPKSETVVKYATMFGVKTIMLTPMQRSIAKLDNQDHKIKRLSLIAKEAAELAHRFDIPQVLMLNTLDSIDFKTFDIVLLADENEKSMTIDQALPNLDKHLKIALIIGPEGGISDQERSRLLNQKAVPITLGMHILPTEIASLYALSYLSIKNV